MVKRMLCLVIGIMFLFGGNGECGVLTGGDYAVSAGPDYVPATVYIRQGGSAGGSEFKVVVYDSTFNLVTNCISSAMARVSSMGTSNATFTGSAALTPSSTYYVGVIGDGYIVFGTDGDGSAQKVNTSGSYASPPASINPASDSGVGEYYPSFEIRNANGDVLLSEGALTDSTNELINIGDKVVYKTSGVTCATI